VAVHHQVLVNLGRNKRRTFLTLMSVIVALFLLLSVVVSCRMVESLTGGKGGTVSTLWPDVPPFAGATKTDLDIPLGARLVLQAAMQGKLSFIAYTTTKPAQEVKDFYTADRMKESGWAPNAKGCTGDTDEKNKGAICIFQRKDGDKQEGLAIIVAENEKEKKTDIFYARFDMTQPTPSPSR